MGRLIGTRLLKSENSFELQIIFTIDIHVFALRLARGKSLRTTKNLSVFLAYYLGYCLLRQVDQYFLRWMKRSNTMSRIHAFYFVRPFLQVNNL